MTARLAVLSLAAVLAGVAALAGADTYYMTDGDRVSGKTLGHAGGFYKVDTPYGRVSIPKGRVSRIVHDDGREEVLSAPVMPSRTGPAAGAVRLIVAISGDSFWQAWNEKSGAPADPSLRLAMALDEEPVVTFLDARTDTDIPHALVNSFSFAEQDVTVSTRGAVKVEPAEVRPDRITLKIDLPREAAGEHAFRIAYQIDEGTASSPSWRDVVSTEIHLTLKADAPNIVEIHQDRGEMEYSGLFHKKMKNVETFRLETKAS